MSHIQTLPRNTQGFLLHTHKLDPPLSLTKYRTSSTHTPLYLNVPSFFTYTHLDLEFCSDSTICAVCKNHLPTFDNTQCHFVLCLWWWQEEWAKRSLCFKKSFLKGSQAPFPSRTSVIIGFTYWVWMITGIILRSIQKPGTWSRPEKPQKVVMDCWSVMAYIL